jgi:hypothetical protein
MRDLPGVVILSLPARSAMYPNPINRALCSAGMTAGGSRTAHVLPTVRRDANSSGVRGADSDAIIRLCPAACIGTWSTLLRWANKAASSVGGPLSIAIALARPCAGADRPAKRSVMLGVSRERPTLTELLPRYGIMACWNTKGLARSASKTVWRKFIGRHPPPLSDDERLSLSPAIP